QGLKANPDSLDLIVMLITLYLQQEDIAGLERAIKQLARLDPHYPALPLLRSMLPTLKATFRSGASKTGMPPLVLAPMPERPKKRR
ncbi:MAG TPA: hypothetical protein VGT44_07335, partial [Ktedonobacteraceae bacterium]|nr:hypothetical protein [Ktedonobacteraceae bacterium]